MKNHNFNENLNTLNLFLACFWFINVLSRWITPTYLMTIFPTMIYNSCISLSRRIYMCVFRSVLIFIACIYVFMLMVRYTITNAKAEPVTDRNKNEFKLGKNILYSRNLEKHSVHKHVIKYLSELILRRNSMLVNIVENLLVSIVTLSIKLFTVRRNLMEDICERFCWSSKFSTPRNPTQGEIFCMWAMWEIYQPKP